MAQANPNDTTRTYALDRLNDSNYQVWKLKIESVLAKAELLGVVDGTEPQPAPNHADLPNWQRKNINTKAEILLHLGDKQVQQIRTLTTAEAIWVRLRALYEHNDITTQMANLKKLTSFILEEDQDVLKFLDDWQRLLDDTIISGLVMVDPMPAALLLNSWMTGNAFLMILSSLALSWSTLCQQHFSYPLCHLHGVLSSPPKPS